MNLALKPNWKNFSDRELRAYIAQTQDAIRRSAGHTSQDYVYFTALNVARLKVLLAEQLRRIDARKELAAADES